jgi:hypothetical protein
MQKLLLFLVVTLAAEGATTPPASLQGIPRVSTQHFVREGNFEGGEAVKANLEAVRFAAHPGGTERWVVDFSDPSSREVGKAAPRFRLQYAPSPGGASKEPRFVFNFRSIQGVHVSREQLAALSKKSRFVKEVVLYPPVEDGDTALELVLRSGVRFETHQPLEKAGRLVLDLKATP